MTNCQNCGGNQWENGKCTYCGTTVVKVPDNVWPIYCIEFAKGIRPPDLQLRPGAVVHVPPGFKVTLVNPG